ncbi:DUF1273 domain-containing protein [Bacillus sp. PAMC26568]|nr:DUF1273 domain-containing protein [Bacillus sp. PAMC26568]
MKVLTISGYKPFELGIFKKDDPAVIYIKKAIEKSLRPLIEEGLEWVLISGQLGVELWAAEVVFELQLEYDELKLGVLTPFLNQEENWNEDNKEAYEFILSQADFVDSITKRKYENPNQFRLKNHFFVSKSEGLLLVYDEDNHGSPKFLLETARKWSEANEYSLMMISFSDLQMIVEEEQSKSDGFWST